MHMNTFIVIAYLAGCVAMVALYQIRKIVIGIAADLAHIYQDMHSNNSHAGHNH